MGETSPCGFWWPKAASALCQLSKRLHTLASAPATWYSGVRVISAFIIDIYEAEYVSQK